MRSAIVASAVVAALAVQSAPASATSVSIENGNQLFVSGHDGETNVITIAEGIDGVTVRDTGAAVITPPPCTSQDANTALCPYPSGQIELLVFAGDNDDRVDLQARPDGRFREVVPRLPNLNGGPGNDVLRVVSGPDTILTGNAGDDQLVGGNGADYLGGGPGNDQLSGNAGDDMFSLGGDPSEVVDHAADADIVSGGEGKDSMLLAAPPGVGVVAIFGGPGSGVPGERDEYANDIEWVQGTPGDDRIVASGHYPPVGVEFHGSDGNDQLVGSNGSDALFGDAGNDTIDPKLAADSVFGGAGDDLITTRDAGNNEPASSVLSYRDSVACDAGTDALIPDTFDWSVLTPAAGCETVERPPKLRLVSVGGSKRGLTRKKNVVTFRSVTCAKDAREPCRGTVKLLYKGGEVAAAGRFTLVPGSTRPVKLKLRAAGRTALKERRAVLVKAWADTPGRSEKLGTQRLER